MNTCDEPTHVSFMKLLSAVIPGQVYLGIIEFPVPILKGNAIFLKELRERLYQQEFEELAVVDFSDVAQGCKTYDEFIDKISLAEECDLQYMGIGIYGNKKLVNKLVGSLPLLR